MLAGHRDDDYDDDIEMKRMMTTMMTMKRMMTLTVNEISLGWREDHRPCSVTWTFVFK